MLPRDEAGPSGLIVSGPEPGGPAVGGARPRNGRRCLRAPAAKTLPSLGPRRRPMAEGNLERTMLLIKPDGVRRGLVGEIIGRMERKGLKIIAAKTLRVTPELAQRHYVEHHGKVFYTALIQHMTSGPVVVLALEGRSAISVVRLLTGTTNPQTAAPGTVRGDLALGLTPNLVHASDSAEAAARELDLYFTPEEYLSYSQVGEEYF